MSGREAVVLLSSALSLAGAGGIAGAFATLRRGGSLAVLLAGAGMLCGVYAALGWGWWLATGVFR